VGAGLDGGTQWFRALGASVIHGLQSPSFLALQRSNDEWEWLRRSRARFSGLYREIAAASGSSPQSGAAVLIVMLDMDRAFRPDLEESYPAHLDSRLHFPGFVSAHLFKAAEAGCPAYLAIYGLADPGSPISKGYLSQTPDQTGILLRDHGRLLVRQVYEPIT
jgi:hypothetical protein